MSERKMAKETRPERDRNKVSVLFVDRKNDLQSQLAEYYTNKQFPGIYQAFSAGPEPDIIDCDMIITMYAESEDIRRQRSKGFDSEYLPADHGYDYIIYTRPDVFEELAGKTVWKGKQILADMGSKDDFAATDDKELSEDYMRMALRIREWVRENMEDPRKLKELVSA
jgi:protein-tyrosine-phosphatase